MTVPPNCLRNVSLKGILVLCLSHHLTLYFLLIIFFFQNFYLYRTTPTHFTSQEPRVTSLSVNGADPSAKVTITYLEANVSYCCVFLLRDNRHTALRWKIEVGYSGFHSGSVAYAGLTLSLICLTNAYETQRLP